MTLRYLHGGDTLVLRPEACNGCGVCVDVCPHDVFRMNGRAASIADRAACMECGACARNCATEAISVRSGVGCAYAVINGLLKGTAPDCGCSGGAGGCEST
jgi:NAD-dependent dihydropyrimidine dehydrogenase PreA subunit